MHNAYFFHFVCKIFLCIAGQNYPYLYFIIHYQPKKDFERFFDFPKITTRDAMGAHLCRVRGCGAVEQETHGMVELLVRLTLTTPY